MIVTVMIVSSQEVSSRRPVIITHDQRRQGPVHRQDSEALATGVGRKSAVVSMKLNLQVWYPKTRAGRPEHTVPEKGSPDPIDEQKKIIQSSTSEQADSNSHFY